eukprot:5185531-Amphidinium_carterae.1
MRFSKAVERSRAECLYVSLTDDDATRELEPRGVDERVQKHKICVKDASVLVCQTQQGWCDKRVSADEG